MGLRVGEDDEVDDQKGCVEHKVGAAYQDRAGPDTELYTGHACLGGVSVPNTE